VSTDRHDWTPHRRWLKLEDGQIVEHDPTELPKGWLVARQRSSSETETLRFQTFLRRLESLHAAAEVAARGPVLSALIAEAPGNDEFAGVRSQLDRRPRDERLAFGFVERDRAWRLLRQRGVFARPPQAVRLPASGGLGFTGVSDVDRAYLAEKFGVAIAQRLIELHDEHVRAFSHAVDEAQYRTELTNGFLRLNPLVDLYSPTSDKAPARKVKSSEEIGYVGMAYCDVHGIDWLALERPPKGRPRKDSVRERHLPEVCAHLVSEGFSKDEIGAQFKISRQAVEKHLKKVALPQQTKESETMHPVPTDEEVADIVVDISVAAQQILANAALLQKKYPTSTILQDTVDAFIHEALSTDSD
jgi:hypothetical protein